MDRRLLDDDKMDFQTNDIQQILDDDAKSQKSAKSHVSIEFSDEAEILRAASNADEDVSLSPMEPHTSTSIPRSAQSSSFKVPRKQNFHSSLNVTLDKRLSNSFKLLKD